MPRLFGLIGFPLSHSFSRKYFSEKFEKEGISDCEYRLFELRNADDFPALFKLHPELQGINVTIPHKKAVLPMLDDVDEGALRVGAVNVIKREESGALKGYNSDYIGFKKSLENWIGPGLTDLRALVLGDGGAASAVKVALEDLKISFLTVSRKHHEDTVSYLYLLNNPEMVGEHKLIVNTTPVGTYPHTTECPDIPYQALTEAHFCYDLIYNPEQTLFMQKALEKGARVKNGYEMLVLQAERAWEIWNQNP